MSLLNRLFGRKETAPAPAASEAPMNIEALKLAMIPPQDQVFIGGGEYLGTANEFFIYFTRYGELKPTDTVLDIGCGQGRMAIPLTTYLTPQTRYEGFDIVPAGIDWCNEKIAKHFPNFHFQVADVYNQMYVGGAAQTATQYRFPFADATFDFVFLTSVFTHMFPNEVEHYASEIGRVLRPGGRCLSTFFLMTEDALSLVAQGKSTQNFVHERDGYRIVKTDAPEEAVGFTVPDVLAMFERYGMKARMPIAFGSWCGRTPSVTYQDFIVFDKIAQTGTTP